MIDAEFRPIESWPGERTPKDERRSSAVFKASYSQTLDLLEHELAELGAHRVVIELALDPSEIRMDGWPRAHARPRHDGVIVSFESVHGPLRYFTDVHEQRWSQDLPGWQANLRAIALGLEALRKVDRYGIGKRGEQYTGWSALPPGTIAAGAATMTPDQAARLIVEAAGYEANDVRVTAVRDDAERRHAFYRAAARIVHPDAGGSTELFQRLEEAKRVLDAGGRP